MQSIHIKVAARNSIRRFAITNTKLSALRQTIANLFGLENSESLWTIKYRDEENELITVTRDDELEFAVKLMGNLLHVVVVEHGPAVAAPSCRDWHERRRYRRDEGCHTEEKRDDHGCRNRSVCLQRKQRKLNERLAFLQQSDNPKAQAQTLKIKQKLAVITSEINTIGSVPAENAGSPDTPVAANQVAVVTPLGPNAAPVPAQLDAKAVKQVYNKFFVMRRDLVSEKKKIDALVEVLRALRAISKHGDKASCPVKVDDEQLTTAQSSLTVARENFVAKKNEVKQQGDLVRQLKKQGHKPPRNEDNQENKAWKEAKWKAKLEEKERKQEAKKKWQEEKAKEREEKLKRQEEKSKEREEKLKRQQEKAKLREEKAAQQAQKAARQQQAVVADNQAN